MLVPPLGGGGRGRRTLTSSSSSASIESSPLLSSPNLLPILPAHQACLSSPEPSRPAPRRPQPLFSYTDFYNLLFTKKEFCQNKHSECHSCGICLAGESWPTASWHCGHDAQCKLASSPCCTGCSTLHSARSSPLLSAALLLYADFIPTC